MAPQIEEHLYRLAQEALHNMVKHADATHVLDQLVIDANELTRRIVDDGKGFDPG